MRIEVISSKVLEIREFVVPAEGKFNVEVLEYLTKNLAERFWPFQILTPEYQIQKPSEKRVRDLMCGEAA
jgi:hypothetical protein